MNFKVYYRDNVTYIEHEDARLDKIVEIVQALDPHRTLDLGCGTGWLTGKLADGAAGMIIGVDVLEDVTAEGWSYVAADVTRLLPFRDGAVDCVVAGEIIEHLPHPDSLLQEIHRVLAPGGTLIVSTPNMVSWANRILVPFGIQPLGTETSSVVALGRRWRILGQGNRVQGHLKVFTHRALTEILERYGFRVTARHGIVSEFPFPVSLIDSFLSHFVPMASDLLFVARCEPQLAPPPPPLQYDPRHERWRKRG